MTGGYGNQPDRTGVLISGVVSAIRETVEDNKTVGPGGAGNAVIPGLTPDKEGLMVETIPSGSDNARQARPPAITSVPLAYNGITYRSHLEADWSCTLTELGIHFEYEPDAYRLPSGAIYHPDFYLPTMGIYAEAKGPHDDRLYKPQELAAALELNEYPRAFLVVVLRPSGPNGGMAWEDASTNALLRLVLCPGCGLWGFAAYDDTWGIWFCRRCDCSEFTTTYLPDVEGSVGPYQTMRRAPRKAA